MLWVKVKWAIFGLDLYLAELWTYRKVTAHHYYLLKGHGHFLELIWATQSPFIFKRQNFTLGAQAC